MEIWKYLVLLPVIPKEIPDEISEHIMESTLEKSRKMYFKEFKELRTDYRKKYINTIRQLGLSERELKKKTTIEATYSGKSTGMSEIVFYT